LQNKNRVLEEKQGRRRFFFAAASDGIAALLAECRFQFKRVFDGERGVKQDTFGTSVYVTLQNTANGFEELKSLLRENGLDYKDFTIYEFFFHLNKALKPKKQDKNGR